MVDPTRGYLTPRRNVRKLLLGTSPSPIGPKLLNRLIRNTLLILHPELLIPMSLTLPMEAQLHLALRRLYMTANNAALPFLGRFLSMN